MPAHRTPPWSQQEIAVLEEFYPSMGVDCVEYLPGRSWRAVHQKAHKLGIACEKATSAPKPRLECEALEEAIRLREDEGWSFARIGAKFGVAEASACNAVLIALCSRKGYTPAERDEHGRITEAGKERLRYALKKGLKGVDIQLRLGVSASCVAEQRRRYQRDLKARGKAPLPPPGGEQAYSGKKLSREKIREVEALFLEGYGTLKVHEATGVSKTSCTRVRNRLIRRLAKKGETLPGCDARGRRLEQKESSRFICPEQVAAFNPLLLQGVPVLRAARETAIGSCTAYRLRNELREKLEVQGRSLPPIDRSESTRGSASSDPSWPPRGQVDLFAFRELLREMPFDQAKERWSRERREERAAEARRPKSFEEQLARIERGEIGLASSLNRPHLAPTIGAAA